MKKVLIILLAMVLQQMEVHAQQLELTAGGAYEKKEVVTVDSVKAGVLFARAMEALSDWAGPDGKAKAGIDFQDKDAGVVAYKGIYSLGFKNVFLGDGWERYANFILKVRCKDGRAQVTVTVPTVTFRYNKNGMTREFTTAQLYDSVLKSKGNRRERGDVIMKDLKDVADGLAAAMIERLKLQADDDF